MLSFLKRLAGSLGSLNGRDGWKRPVALEKAMGYRFKDPKLLKMALSHRSWVNNVTRGARPPSNERLEFLGDSVMNAIITDTLYRRFPGCDEGELSKMKSLVVSAKVLVPCAEQLDLGAYMLLSKSEEKSGGRSRHSILADAYEAVLGAVYLDGGYEAVRSLMKPTLIRIMDDVLIDQDLANYKSLLLEYTQSRGFGSPHYSVIRESGPEHRKVFVVAAMVRGEEWGRGTGGTKKDAEQACARDALEKRDALVGG
ncbi:MAG TPA: ribonuclease III [Fibrobacteria bacterium]|jgi:ribonuclease-3|nr:ribonuclease III [Fibrobacteria bacterium]